MKNLIAELLVKLAEKEEESKELVAQVEALEIVVTALLRHHEGVVIVFGNLQVQVIVLAESLDRIRRITVECG